MEITPEATRPNHALTDVVAEKNNFGAEDKDDSKLLIQEASQALTVENVRYGMYDNGKRKDCVCSLRTSFGSAHGLQK